MPSTYENPFHGAQILEEVGGALGLLLWQRVRDVVLWSKFLPLGGGGLFDTRNDVPFKLPAHRVDAALASALEALSKIVTEGDRVTAQEVADACSEVREWALRDSLSWTAAYFAEAAAATRPLDPMFPVYAGRVARTQAQFPRGAQWFKRAIGLARRSEKWDVYIIALLGLAQLETLRGRTSHARRYLVRAWKTAVEYKLWKLGAEARHDLMGLDIYVERYRQAAEHATVALRLYGEETPNIPALAHDWGYLWAWQGHYSAALPVLEAALPFMPTLGARVLALSNIAWSAAAVGDVRRYRSARETLFQLLPLAPESAAIALVNLARGTIAVEGPEAAEELARRARHLAEGREESAVVRFADGLLSAITNGSGLPVEVDPPPGTDLGQIATKLIERIRRSAAGN